MSKKDIKFENLPAVDDISGLIKDIFDVELDISGGWGYNNTSALEIKNLAIPIEQFFQMFASMRANIEMNLTLDEDTRYAGINVTKLEHKTIELENKEYNVLTFKISAIKEKEYNNFIQEYKDNFGKKEFDLEKHFKSREASTIKIESDFWFIL